MVSNSLSFNTKVVTLDPDKINKPELLAEWDRLWVRTMEIRLHLSRARQANEPLTVQSMQDYEQARNAERQFFWDNFYTQVDG